MKPRGEIPPTGIIMPSERRKLLIGSAYQSDIFYRYGAKIAPEHASIFHEDGELIFRAVSTDGILINLKDGEPKRLKKERGGGGRFRPEYGDEVRLYGLCIRFFGNTMFVDAYYGDLRIALRERRDPSAAYG